MSKIIQYYDLPDAKIAERPFNAGALYVANDTGKMYFDSVDANTRVDVANDVMPVATEAARTALLAPIPGRLYCVLESGCIYLYVDGAWNKLGNRPQIHFENIVITKGTSLVLEDSKILATDTAVFVPDLSVADLVTASTCTCAAGKVTITVTANYDIPGRVIVN